MSERTQVGSTGPQKKLMSAVRVDDDPWLSSVLGYAVFRLRPAEHGGRPASSFFPPDFEISKRAFLYAKCPAEDLAYCHCLESAGFRLIETSVVFEKAASTPKPMCDRRVCCRTAEPRDCDTVAALAGRSFRYSRFHRDPLIGPETANRIKTEWARNYFAGRRGDAMVVAEVRGIVAGFAQILKGQRAVTVDLIAVDERFRRQGVGRALLGHVEAVLADGKPVVAGTQIVNAPSIALYGQCGYSLSGASYVFHCHLPFPGVGTRK